MTTVRSHAASVGRLLSTLALALVAAAPATAQVAPAAPAKRALSMEDLLSWKGIRNPTLSNDGRWMAYVLAPNEGDAEFTNFGIFTLNPRLPVPFQSPNAAWRAGLLRQCRCRAQCC